MKILDSVIGSISVYFFSTLQRVRLVNYSSILIIRPGGIGDAALLIPAIKSIKTSFPSAEITVLCEVRNFGVFGLCSDIDHILLYDRPNQLLSALHNRYDLVIDTEQWHRLSAVVARLTRAPTLIGFATNQRARLFNHQIEYLQDDYEMHSFQNLLAPLNIKPALTENKFLSLPEAAVRKIPQILDSMTGKPFVTIFPGASIPERKWGAIPFRKLLELLTQFGIGGVVVGGKEEEATGDVIVSGCSGLNLAGKTSLSETAAIIEKSSLLISGDSGILHIAVGLGKPTVSLFGPGRADKWAPRGDHHTVINKQLPCSPCTTFGNTPKCPIDAQCLKEIKVDEVFNAVMMLLTSTGAVSSLCCKKDWVEVSSGADN